MRTERCGCASHGVLCWILFLISQLQTLLALLPKEITINDSVNIIAATCSNHMDVEAHQVLSQAHHVKLRSFCLILLVLSFGFQVLPLKIMPVNFPWSAGQPHQNLEPFTQPTRWRLNRLVLTPLIMAQKILSIMTSNDTS